MLCTCAMNRTYQSTDRTASRQLILPHARSAQQKRTALRSGTVAVPRIMRSILRLDGCQVHVYGNLGRQEKDRREGKGRGGAREAAATLRGRASERLVYSRTGRVFRRRGSVGENYKRRFTCLWKHDTRYVR